MTSGGSVGVGEEPSEEPDGESAFPESGEFDVDSEAGEVSVKPPSPFVTNDMLDLLIGIGIRTPGVS